MAASLAQFHYCFPETPKKVDLNYYAGLIGNENGRIQVTVRLTPRKDPMANRMLHFIVHTSLGRYFDTNLSRSMSKPLSALTRTIKIRFHISNEYVVKDVARAYEITPLRGRTATLDSNSFERFVDCLQRAIKEGKEQWIYDNYLVNYY